MSLYYQFVNQVAFDDEFPTLSPLRIHVFGSGGGSSGSDSGHGGPFSYQVTQYIDQNEGRPFWVWKYDDGRQQQFPVIIVPFSTYTVLGHSNSNVMPTKPLPVCLEPEQGCNLDLNLDQSRSQPHIQPQPQPQPEPEPQPLPQPQPQPEHQPQSLPQRQLEPEHQPQPLPQPQLEPQPEPEPEPQPQPLPRPQPEPQPRMATRRYRPILPRPSSIPSPYSVMVLTWKKSGGGGRRGGRGRPRRRLYCDVSCQTDPVKIIDSI